MRGRNTPAKSFNDTLADLLDIIFHQIIRKTGGIALFTPVHRPDELPIPGIELLDPRLFFNHFRAIQSQPACDGS